MRRLNKRELTPWGCGLATGLMASTMLAGTPALAQKAAATPGTGEVTEVVVTAQKREETLQHIPMSVQALDVKRLDQLNITEFNDYVKFMPSVAFQTLGPNQTSIYMRGVASGDNANHSGPLPSVGAYLDEQPITTIGGTLDVHIYDIARIEVLPGPQGTLYGASSEAGTLRIITNQPSSTAFAAGYDLEGNGVAHGGGGYVAEGFVNVPLIANHAAIRLVAFDESDAGYIDNVFGTRTFPTSGHTIDNSFFAKGQYNPANTAGGRAALKIDLDENWTITPSVVHQDQFNRGVFGYQPAVGDLQVQRFNEDVDHDRWTQLALTINGKLYGWDITYSGGTFARQVDSRVDYTDYSIAYDSVFGSGAYWQDSNGNPLANPQQEIIGRDRFSKQSNELRFASPTNLPVRLLVGLFQERQTHWIIQDYQIQGFGPQISVPGWKNTIWLTDQNRLDKDEAVFAEGSWDVTSQFTLTAGVRGYDYHNSLYGFYGYSAGYNALTGFSSGEGVDNVNCKPGLAFNSAPCVNLNKTVTGSGETHKVNASFKFDSQRMIYFTYSTGFRPGGVNRNADFGPYQADFLTNYELGWKTTWFDHSLAFNGAFYDEQWDQFQFSFLGPNSLTIVENAPSATIRGVETSLEWRPTHQLSLSGGAAYNHATLDKNFCGVDSNGALIPSCADADAIALKGQKLPYTPDFKVNMTVRYTFDLMGWDAHAQASLLYQDANGVGLRTADIQELGNMPAYTTADLSFGADKDRKSIELFIKNAFDTRGQQNRYTPCTVATCTADIPGTPKFLYVVPIQPLTVGLRIGQRF